MIEKFILHLKNVIFFQAVVCFFCISLLIWLIRTFNKEYIASNSDKQNAQQILTEETLKLYSVANSSEKILQVYKKYGDVISTAQNQECENYLMLIDDIKNLSIKYALIEPIEVNMKKFFLRNNFPGAGTNQDKIKIENYDVNLTFAAQDFIELLKILREAYSYMPHNTIVTYLKVRNQYVLEPAMIYKLSSAHSPDFIYTQLNMRTRKINSKKIDIYAYFREY